MSIYRLPPETLEDILIHCDPLHVAAFAQCSRAYSTLVYHSPNQHLWRVLYLAQPLDDPRTCISHIGLPRESEIDWTAELQAIIRARTVVKNVKLCKPEERCTILQTLLNLVLFVPPLRSHTDIDHRSRNLRWVLDLLEDGDFIEVSKIPWTQGEEEKQLRARLHTLLGLTPGDMQREGVYEARTWVYNLRHHTWDNDFGPLRPGKHALKVNWEHLQAARRILYKRDLAKPFDFQEDGLLATQIVVPEEVNPLDWAGIEGRWHGYFHYADHGELLRYNRSEPYPHGPLDKDIVSAPTFHEGSLLVMLDLKVVASIPNPDNPKRPKLAIAGIIGEHGIVTLSGWVYLSEDGCVRLQYVSGENGHVHWSCQGVHVGGLRSKVGIYGAWSTVAKDPEDPIGPFHFWRPN